MSNMLQQDEPDYKRIMLAIFLAATLLMYWQAKVEYPRRQALAKLTIEHAQQKSQEAQHISESRPDNAAQEAENTQLTHEQRLALSPRLAIASDMLQGSIALKGARFDDLRLRKYRESLAPDSPLVTLLSPNGDANGYVVQVGWVAGDDKTKVPDEHTLWQADKKTLTPRDPVTLRWNNGEGVTYALVISLDKNYMFDIRQQVDNHSGHEISVVPYAYTNRVYTPPEHTPFLHEGPTGVMNSTLNEAHYKELKEKGNKTFDDVSGWFGITDHYWLTALIPTGEHYKVTYSYYTKNDRDRYQVDYLGAATTVADGAAGNHEVRLFAGAKELSTMSAYANGDAATYTPPIPLFDRALDFGVFYFLAKPMCIVVDMLYDLTGNFGVALLLFIILVKAVLYPVANKSYKSMAQMRKLQPEMLKLRERYVDDQIAMHKAMRDLYKRENINPAAGCLPIFFQIIVFLALFRGLNVMIEMRHAPFYGWIKDLSAPDTSNLFNLFGAIDWTPPAILHLGLLPIFYCITMVIQQRQQPKPADPVQAKTMMFMPFLMLIFFDKMASGFVLYWTWSNILSIFQQGYISRKYADSQAAVTA